MYRISTPGPQQMIIRHSPLMQRAVGLLFVLGGCSILFFVFPDFVHLRCDRQQSLCSLKQSNLVRSETRVWTVQDMTGAQLEVLDASDSGTAFKIWIMTRQGPEAFTPYGIGGLRGKKQAMVAEINAYVENASINELEAIEDERKLFYPLAAGLICFGLLPLFFVRTVTCDLDRRKNNIVLKNSGLWGNKILERRLSDLSEASIDAEMQGGVRMCWVVFKFRSGETIPLTYYRYYNCEKARRVAETINDFLSVQ